MTDFAPIIQEALLAITPTDGPTKVDEGIEAARRLANDPRRRQIVVFSDGCLPNRDQIRAARIVANPGCYPTAAALGFLPLLEQGLVDTECLIADWFITPTAARSTRAGTFREFLTHAASFAA